MRLARRRGIPPRIVRLSGLAVGVALVLAPVACAGVDVSPARVAPGAEAQLTFSIPNQTGVTITRIAIGLPPDVALGPAGPRQGWRMSRSAHTIAWENGAIKSGELETFVLSVSAPRQTERAVFSVLVSHADGRTDTYHPSIAIARAPSTTDKEARTLAEAALVVASAAALVALGSGLLGLWLWLRPRPPDPF